MARTCTVCTHAERAAIDRALVAGEPFRHIASRQGVSTTALQRHKAEHIPAALAAAGRAEDAAAAIDVMAELRRCVERVNLLFDSCYRWLRDADDPTRYDIGPRASDLIVTYETVDPETNRAKARKEPLSRLLARVEGLPTVDGVLVVESKHADPRELVLKAADRLRAQSELLAKLLGDLDERPQVVLVNAPEWHRTRSELLDALGPYPDARAAVAARLAALEAPGAGE